jgi:predicted nucleotidyltransferase
MAAIRRTVQEIVRRFQPVKVILFGSYAGGRPTPDSDVDLLVVMPAANEINQAVRILLAVPHPFSLDLIVRTPETLQRRLALGDSFLQEVVDTGRVLYEKTDRRMGSQSGSRPRGRATPARA